MFLKNNIRPAFATATAGGQAQGSKLRNDSFTYDAGASETDDFGSFSSGSAQGSGSGAQRGGKKTAGGLKPSAIIIAVAAIVAVILLIVLVVAIANSSDGHIKYEDNSFVAFCDEDGIYHVAANGKVVGEYENEISLIVADDRSFAYIIEYSEDGYRINIVDGKKNVTEVTPSPVTKVLATATLTPGIVWLDADNGIYHYTTKRGEERITRDVEDTRALDDETFFHISADAETVTYTKYDPERNTEYLCIYTDSTETKFQKLMYPVAVSNDGSMVYAYASRDGVTNALYVLPFNDENDRYLISDNFNSIVDINTAGNEIVFTTTDDTGAISTYLVAFNLKKMDEVAQPTRIAKGYVFTPVSADNEVACFSTYADCYFEANVSDLDLTLDATSPVYYVSKSFEIRRISKFAGQFDPDGKYFYYTNNDGTLQKVDLSDKDAVPQKIAEDIIDFEITQKGNLYWLDDTSRLMFYNSSKEKKTRIADNVEGISMHNYSNTLYFTFTDAISIYTTEEGSAKEAAKFDSSVVTGLPAFADSNYKKTFAAFFDVDNEEWRLFYTSNGKSFSLIAVCSELDGIDASDLFIGSIGSSTPETSDTESETTEADEE